MKIWIVVTDSKRVLVVRADSKESALAIANNYHIKVTGKAIEDCNILPLDDYIHDEYNVAVIL